MRKVLMFLMLALVSNGARAELDAEKRALYQREFIKGATVGAVVALIMDYARAHFLPDATGLHLYDNYGICRDQLTGQLKIVTSTAGLYAAAAFEEPIELTPFEILVARVAGIFTGSNIAVCVKTLLYKTV